MAITGAQHAITPARAGLARSGATRSGWPIAIGQRALLFALSNIARSGATRSNYTSGATYVSIGGSQIGGAPGVAGEKIIGDLTIADVLEEQPNRATFRLRRAIPTIGQDVIVTVGSKHSLDRLFAGQVLTLAHGYVGTPANYYHDVNAIDWTWGLNHKRVAGRWLNTSATTIAAALLAAGAPGYSSEYVALGLPILEEFTVTRVELAEALTQLATRIGGYWYVDYHRRLHLYTTTDPEPVTNPTVINAIHPTLTELVIERDGSPLVTRVSVEGGGSNATAAVPSGETRIPVGTITWYETGGGEVVSGPQRIRYTGIVAGGGGGLVGPGAAPSGAPNATAVGGAGMEAGIHEYAITFTTAAGESLPGPRRAVAVGVIPAPAGAPVVGSVAAGAGPDPGYHRWAVTFLTATGETTIGPEVVALMPPGTPPLVAPTPTTPTFGGAIEPGSFQYAVTVETAGGESIPGPLSSVVTLTSAAAAPPPASAPVPGTVTTGGAINAGLYYYLATFETALGESAPGPSSVVAIVQPGPPIAAPPSAPTFDSYLPGSAHIGGNLQWAVTFVTANGGETLAGPLSAVLTTGPGVTGSVLLANVPLGGPTVIERRVYRLKQVGSDATFPGEGYGLSYVGTIYNNEGTTLQDNAATVGGAPPTTNTSEGPAHAAIPITAIPIGPTGTIARSLYRSDLGAYRLVIRIANNASSTYTDTTPTSGLGAAVGGGSSAQQSAIPLTEIPRGPTGTIARHLYRSKHSGPLAKLTTIANNTSAAYTDTTPTSGLGAAPPTVDYSGPARVTLTAIPIGGGDVTGRRLYRTRAGETILRLALTLGDNTTTSAVDAIRDSALGATPPATATALANRVQLSAIPVGASTVLARKLYRTPANGAALKLAATLGDNTTANYLDLAADGTLGAAAPTLDTSGLQQPPGVVPAGATTLIVAGPSGFSTGGGWAVIGNGAQVIRYQGLTATALVGIPAVGPGAITASIAYNSTVTEAPQLIGVAPAGAPGAILYGIPMGQEINLWVQLDDPAAQALVAALLSSAAAGAHNGVIEEVIQDRRLSAVECRARGRAYLTHRTAVHLRVRYRTRDLNTRTGRTVTIALTGAPYFLNAQFKIQSVTIRSFTPALLPIFDVEASSVRFSFEDLLRRIRDTPRG